MRRAAGLFIAGLAGVVALAGVACSNVDQSVANQRAQQLVAQVGDLSPELDVETAESVYGDSAPTVCGLLTDSPVNIVTWARTYRGMPADETSQLVEVDRVVVQVYCPDELDRFNELLDSLNYRP